MSSSKQTIAIQLPSGRVVHTEVPAKVQSAPVCALQLLGAAVRFATHPKTKKQITVQTGFFVYEVPNTMDIVLVRANLTPAVKGVGEKTLDLLIKETSLTPEKAVLEKMATFTHSLESEGFYILDNGIHKWVRELPQTDTQTTEEVNGDDLM